MLLRRHLEFKTHENDAFSGECDCSDEAERHRIESPQDCRRLRSACVVEVASIWGEIARAGSEASARRRSTKCLHAERRRIKTPQDCGRLRSACVGEAARAEIEASPCWRSAKRLHVDTRISPASYSMRVEDVAFSGGRSAERFPDRKRMNPGSRSTERQTEPNKAVEPTPVAVTNRASPPFGRARFAPATSVAHL